MSAFSWLFFIGSIVLFALAGLVFWNVCKHSAKVFAIGLDKCVAKGIITKQQELLIFSSLSRKEI
jgi:hypothetical protein